VEVLN